MVRAPDCAALAILTLATTAQDVGLTFGGPLDHDTRPLVLWSEAAEMDMNTTLSDITSEIDYAVANNVWLIILFHRVDETDPCCSSISVDHSLIQGTVDYLVQHKFQWSPTTKA